MKTTVYLLSILLLLNCTSDSEPSSNPDTNSGNGGDDVPDPSVTYSKKSKLKDSEILYGSDLFNGTFEFPINSNITSVRIENNNFISYTNLNTNFKRDNYTIQIPDNILDTIWKTEDKKSYSLKYQDDYSITNDLFNFKNFEYYTPFLYSPESNYTKISEFPMKKIKGDPDYKEGLYESYIKYPDGDEFKIQMELKYDTDSVYKFYRKKFVNGVEKEHVIVGASSVEYVNNIIGGGFDFDSYYSFVKYNNTLYLTPLISIDETLTIYDMMDKNLFLNSFE